MKMNNKENDIIYTAKDIQDYLQGRLTPLQMHAMEKAALDDPLLAEAMEGYQGMPNDDWKEQLAALKNNFSGEKQQAKVIALPQRKNNWWKVAAAVLLLGGAATIAYQITNKKTNKEIAKNEQPAAGATNIDTLKTADVASTEGTLSSAKPQTIPPEPNLSTTTQSVTVNKAAGNVAANEEQKLKDDNNFLYTPAKPDAKTTAKLETKTGDAEVLKDINNTASAAPSVSVENNTVAAEKNEAAKKYYTTNSNAFNGNLNSAQYQKSKTAADKGVVAEFKKEPSLNHNFRALVVGPDNSPLPFANISIKSENFGTYADAKGNFRLISADSLLTVEVKAAGYQPQFYTLQSFAQQNKIVLAEEDAASRYKTIGSNNALAKNKTSRRATLLKDSLVNVEPADGWDNYNTYVDNNIEIPDDILKKDIHGQVELSFDVSSNGTISNIKVDKSLCDNCDELAKRLIEQGPQWKVKKGKKGKGKITVQF